MNEIMIIGVTCSLIYSEITGYSPGGVIVPAYFALFIDSPDRILATLLVSAVSLFIVKGLSNVMILYGRRRFVVYLLVGIYLKYLISYFVFEDLFMFYDIRMTIGFLIPGILAKDMEKQGSLVTLLSLGIVAVATRLLQIVLFL